MRVRFSPPAPEIIFAHTSSFCYILIGALSTRRIPMNLVKRAVVARFLKVSSNNLGHWVKAGEIQEVECGLLTVPAINEFLCRCARGFGNNPPTWEDIRSGRLVFLHYSEMERFGFSIQQLRLLRKSEKLQYFKFPGLRGESRYLEASVAKHTNRTASGYSVLQTRHILG